MQCFCSLSRNCLEVENRLGIIFIFIGCSTEILQDKLQGPMDMLHFAMSAKCVASLRQSLQKVEPDSYFVQCILHDFANYYA